MARISDGMSSAAARRLRSSNNTGGGGSSSSPYKPRTALSGQQYTSRGNSGRASGSIRGGSSGGYRAPIRSNSSGQYSPPMSPPGMSPGGGAVPDINAFLGGDTGYQQQLRQFAKALTDFNADITRRRGVLDQDFGTSKKALGDQRLLDLKNIEEDYSSRGLQRSGLYAGAVGDYEKEFGTRMTDLSNAQQQAIAQLLQQQTQFKSQNTLQGQAAKEAALRRRAEQYGI